jgi:type IV secretion system protein VirB5
MTKLLSLRTRLLSFRFHTVEQREEHERAEGRWMERYGTYIEEARVWRWVAAASMAIAAICAGGMVWLSGQSQFVPYVVKVDKLGSAVAVDRADRASTPDRTVIVAQIARWITDVRTVYADAAAQRALILEAYAMINQRGAAFAAVNDHMSRHDPFQRARTETVSVEVESVLPLAGDSWRIEWREETRSRDGKLGESQRFQATISINVSRTASEAGLRANPMGLYIDSFAWAQRL